MGEYTDAKIKTKQACKQTSLIQQKAKEHLKALGNILTRLRTTFNEKQAEGLGAHEKRGKEKPTNRLPQ